MYFFFLPFKKLKLLFIFNCKNGPMLLPGKRRRFFSSFFSLLCLLYPGEATMTWVTTTWTAVTLVMPSSAIQEPETTAPVLSMSSTCV